MLVALMSCTYDFSVGMEHFSWLQSERSTHFSHLYLTPDFTPDFLHYLLCPDEETGLEIHKISRPPGFNMERRRSRAVLYQLSGHLQKQDKTKSKLKINNVRPSSSFDVIRIDLVLVRGHIRPLLPQHFTPECKTIVRVGFKRPWNICLYIRMLERLKTLSFLW